MAEYKDAKGIKVQSLSADPPAPFVGQVWYNTTSGDLKYYGDAIPGSWATGGSLGTAKYQTSGAGTKTAALNFGGAVPSPYVPTNLTEEYDGSAWTAGGTLSTSRRAGAGFGLQTAALLATGTAVPGRTNSTEEYDGSTWTAGGNVGSSKTQ